MAVYGRCIKLAFKENDCKQTNGRAVTRASRTYSHLSHTPTPGPANVVANRMWKETLLMNSHSAVLFHVGADYIYSKASSVR